MVNNLERRSVPARWTAYAFQGTPQEPPRAQKVNEYLAGLPPTSQDWFLTHLTIFLNKWPTMQAQFDAIDRQLRRERLPWLWKLEQSPDGKGTLTERQFISVDELIGHLQSRVSWLLVSPVDVFPDIVVLHSLRSGANPQSCMYESYGELGRGIYVADSVVNTRYERVKGLNLKHPVEKFDWCVSVITLAILGSECNIAPDVLFPPVRLWHDNSDTALQVTGGLQIMDSSIDMLMPSRGQIYRPKLPATRT